MPQKTVRDFLKGRGPLPKTLTLEDINDVLHRHRGSITRVAESLTPPITHNAVTLWLQGKTVSARIAEAAQAKASELLQQEFLDSKILEKQPGKKIHSAA